MALKSYTSPVLAKAQRRFAALKAIDEKVDLGNGIDVNSFTAGITALTEVVSKHNSTIANFNASKVDVGAKELALNDLMARGLAAVAVKYGRDSREYAQAGGIRRSDRKRPHRRSAQAALKIGKEDAPDVSSGAAPTEDRSHT